MAMFGMSDDMKAQLIQEIQKRPLIWKVSDPKYTDVPSRWLAFEEIAHKLSDSYMTFSSDMIKIAWKNMMDYYNQIRRRHDRATIAGTPFTKPKWQFYEMMHFVRQDKPAVKRKYNWIEPSKICDLSGGVPASKLMGKEYEDLVSSRSSIRDKDVYGAAVQNESHLHSSVPVIASAGNNRSKNIKRQQENLTKPIGSTKVAEREGTSKASSVCAKNTPRREGLRQAPRKSLWLVKKEYVTDEVDDWDVEPPRKTFKRSPVANSPSKSQRNRSQLHKGDSDISSSVFKAVTQNNEILSPIDANATEPLSNMDAAIAFGRQIVARLNSLSATNYCNACKEIEKVIAKFEGSVDKAKSRKVATD